MTGRFDQRVVVVTGSTRGVGRATAELLAGEGALVVINSRSSEECERVAQEIGHGAVAVAEDVATEDGCRRLIRRTLQRCGRIDTLVNNAGAFAVAPSVDFPVDEWRKILDVNLTGPFILCQLAAEAMFAQGSGTIVNVASVSGVTTPPRRIAYVSSKAALIAMTKALAAEWAPTIRVNAVVPGFMKTELYAQLVAEGKVDPSGATARTPYGRLGRPEEVAQGIAYLASDEASYVAGAVLPVDGAWLVFGQNL